MKRILFVFIMFIITPITVLAKGSINVSISSLSIELGSSKSFTISSNNAVGDVAIELSDDSIISVSDNTWETGIVGAGENKSGTIKVNGLKVGSSIITLKIDGATFDNEDLSGTIKKIYVDVIDKAQEGSTSMKLTPYYGYIKLEWEKEKSGKGYLIYRKESGGKYKLIKKTANLKTTIYRDKSVKKGTTYYYKVKSYKVKNGKTIKLKTYDIMSGKLNKVPSINAKITHTYKNKIKLSWDKKSVSGYQIYRATSKNGKYILIKTITSKSKTTYTDTYLKSGKTYYYKVRAYKTISGFNRNNGVFSKVSGKTTK